MNDELPDNLARALKELDADATRAGRRVDPEKVAAGVLKRLRAEPGVEIAPPVRRSTWMRVAAAMALLLTGVAVGRYALNDSVPINIGLPVDVSMATADSLSVDSLAARTDALLNAVDSVRAVSDTVQMRTVISVDDLTETELRTLLQSMQSTEGES